MFSLALSLQFRRRILTVVLSVLAISWAAVITNAQAQNPVSYLRFEQQGEVAYGLLREKVIQELSTAPFAGADLTGRTFQLDQVRLLPPSVPSKVFAVGMNFASHSASDTNAPPPLFLKLPSSLTGHQSKVTLPPDAQNLHFEGELVLVIGRQAHNVSEADAADYIFGVTAGNDLTERSWQSQDLQWMRAKASDGFGPVGPVLVTGLDPTNLLLTTRLNGEVVQQENTQNMIHKPAKVVSYLSRYFTLEPGDMIFMGTPGRTSALEEGDVISVTIEGIGTLSNQVTWKTGN